MTLPVRPAMLPGDGVGALIAEAAAVYEALLAEALAPCGLTPSAGRLLRALFSEGRPWIAQAEAMRLARLPPMDVSRLLGALERSGLVERGPRVGRGRTVRLTARGEEAARSAVGATREAERGLLQPIGSERGGLRFVLRQLVNVER